MNTSALFSHLGLHRGAAIALALAAFGFAGAGRMTAAAGEANALTPAERASGWKLLFDGKSLAGWRGFKESKAPGKGWVVEEGILKKRKGVPGGDLMTEEAFAEFELAWDWRIEPKGNSGVKYFITPERGSAIGHEYQMIDEGPSEGRTATKRTTASFYDVLPPSSNKPPKAPGEWNHSRIRVKGNQVEHWLNGEKALAYELGSPTVLAAIQQSKFKTVKGFGTRIRGHILLTDHNDECWFRSIKLLDLGTK